MVRMDRPIYHHPGGKENCRGSVLWVNLKLTAFVTTQRARVSRAPTTSVLQRNLRKFEVTDDQAAMKRYGVCEEEGGEVEIVGAVAEVKTGGPRSSSGMAFF